MVNLKLFIINCRFVFFGHISIACKSKLLKMWNKNVSYESYQSSVDTAVVNSLSCQTWLPGCYSQHQPFLDTMSKSYACCEKLWLWENYPL